jgi:hypothetical protein
MNKLNSTYLQKAEDDEPIFVLRAKDPLAETVIRSWIDAALQTGLHSNEKADEANETIAEMLEWKKAKGIQDVYMFVYIRPRGTNPETITALEYLKIRCDEAEYKLFCANKERTSYLDTIDKLNLTIKDLKEELGLLQDVPDPNLLFTTKRGFKIYKGVAITQSARWGGWHDDHYFIPETINSHGILIGKPGPGYTSEAEQAENPFWKVYKDEKSEPETQLEYPSVIPEGWRKKLHE